MAAEMMMHDFQLLPAMQEHPVLNGQKRTFDAAIIDDARYEDPSIANLPSFDKNAWYYPSQEYEFDDVRLASAKGNWGRKLIHNARWTRTGKIAPWAPGLEDRQVEERARKRIKMLMPEEAESSTSIVLPHLRSPSPPLTAPYPPPTMQHLSYTSFVMDKAVTRSFRSRLLDELESATNSLIEGEATMRRALGRLWQVMSEDPDGQQDTTMIPKREDGGEEEDEREQRLARAPDLTPIVHKLFISDIEDRATPTHEMPHFPHPEYQLDSLEKSLAALRALQDDSREYVERLEEIRDDIGFTRTQRNGVWDLVRNKALKELQDVVASSAAAL